MGGRGWWTISGEALIAVLHRAHQGEDPELLYAELYANMHVDNGEVEPDGN